MPVARTRVDHVAIAVESIDAALDFFLTYFPARADAPKQPGYDDSFHWANLRLGHFKIELIESAREGSFVDRFISRRGEGLHHLTFHVDHLDPIATALEREGVRLVDRFEAPDGRRTVFLHPKAAFGTLIQLWESHELRGGEVPAPNWGGTVEKDGVTWMIDHLSLALHELDPAIRFFREHFAGRIEIEKHPGYDRTFSLVQMKLGDYRLELMEPLDETSFLTRFLGRRGEGMHHISIDVDDLDTAIAPLERAGCRIVDRFEMAPDWKTAFVHPKSAFGVLIQFWQMPEGEWVHPTI